MNLKKRWWNSWVVQVFILPCLKARL